MDFFFWKDFSNYFRICVQYFYIDILNFTQTEITDDFVYNLFNAYIVDFFLNFIEAFNYYFLAILSSLPLIILFILLLNPKTSSTFQYKIVLLWSGIAFFFSIILLINRIDSPLYYVYERKRPISFFEFRFESNGVSIFFILLTNFFIFLCILSLSSMTPRLYEALCYLLFLQWSVIATFLVIDILGFFLFFEITLIPIYFLVLIWGSRERRVRASYLIAIYTLFGSIFMFFNLLYLFSKLGTTDYNLILQIVLTQEDQRFLWITFFLAFAAKVPVFPFHIWLPEAHVEAPTIGSVLLAVLMLKLGTYGLIRFCIPLFPEGTLYFSSIVSTLAIIGVIYTCLTAIRQIDLKKIIAYSSVGHINVVLLGIISGTSEALQGAIFQRLSHGIVSGALFFSVGALYIRYSVRSLKYFGGLAHFYPFFTIIFLLFSLANISFPLTSSFIGEFLIFVGLFRYNFWAAFFSATSMVLGAVYTLWSFNRIFFGNLSVFSVITFADLNRKEFALFFPLVISLFSIGLYPTFYLNIFFYDSIRLLEHADIHRQKNL